MSSQLARQLQIKTNCIIILSVAPFLYIGKVPWEALHIIIQLIACVKYVGGF